jgi:hypothetical protein
VARDDRENRARARLDKYVTLRGDIAHRGQASAKVRKADVEDFLKHVTRLVGKTGGRVNSVVAEATGRPLWKKGRRPIQ